MKNSAASGEPGGAGGSGRSGAKKETEPEKKEEEAAKEDAKADEGKGGDKGEGEGKKEGGDKQGDKKDGKEAGEGDAKKIKVLEDVPIVLPPVAQSWADLFYRVGFWILLCMVLIMSICWYWNVRYLRRLLAQYKPLRPVRVRT